MTIANLIVEGCPLEAPDFENLLVEDLLFECVICIWNPGEHANQQCCLCGMNVLLERMDGDWDWTPSWLGWEDSNNVVPSWLGFGTTIEFEIQLWCPPGVEAAPG